MECCTIDDKYNWKRTIINPHTKRRKATGPRTFVVSPAFAALQMNGILEALNSQEIRVPEPTAESEWGWEWRTKDVSERKQELRGLIELWLGSGQNLYTLFKKHPELQEPCTAGKTFLIPNRDGEAQLAWSPALGDFRSSPQKRAALVLFIEFLINPLCTKLWGPCERCEKYYLRNRVDQKKYCKKQCGAASTALAATQDRREKQQEAKLEIAKQAILEWNERPRRGDWKRFVAARVSASAKEPVTVKWVTRAKLVPPSSA
jgi:hypothetical protein